MAQQRWPRVSAVVRTKDPDVKHLTWTLDSLADQDYPNKEVVIVDASAEPLSATVEGVPTTVLHEPEMGIAEATETGMRAASGEYIMPMDEDTVFISRDYISRAMEELQNPSVSGAGGVVFPIRGNAEGRMIAALDRVNPSSLGTHTILFPRIVCLDENGDLCNPMANRGEDRSLRKQLREYGEIRRMDDQAVLKDLPTTRQKSARNTIVGSILGGVVTSLLTSYITSALTDIGEDALEAT
jgi:glycosyltransferase involved in cell wall biosynthesis